VSSAELAAERGTVVGSAVPRVPPVVVQVILDINLSTTSCLTAHDLAF